MKEWIGTALLKIESPSVVSIGKFDGDHRGHRKIFSTMKEIAKKEGYVTAVFTFMTPPSVIVSGNDKLQITTNEERREKLRQAGIDCLVEYPFDVATASMSGEEFVREILIQKMNMKAIVAGPDCSFGKDRSGDANLLRKLGEKFGFATHIIEKERADGQDISSTLIRKALLTGNLERANRLLGEIYTISGSVESGNRIGGRLLGFPTVNLHVPEGKLMPRFGVYETEVTLPDGKKYRGITNVGRNPSVEEDKFLHRARIETFLLDYSGDLYGKYIQVGFLRFLRPEIKFRTMKELKDRIEKDIESIR